MLDFHMRDFDYNFLVTETVIISTILICPSPAIRYQAHPADPCTLYTLRSYLRVCQVWVLLLPSPAVMT